MGLSDKKWRESLWSQLRINNKFKNKNFGNRKDF